MVTWRAPWIRCKKYYGGAWVLRVTIYPHPFWQAVSFKNHIIPKSSAINPRRWSHSEITIAFIVIYCDAHYTPFYWCRKQSLRQQINTLNIHIKLWNFLVSSKFMSPNMQTNFKIWSLKDYIIIPVWNLTNESLYLFDSFSTAFTYLSSSISWFVTVFSPFNTVVISWCIASCTWRFFDNRCKVVIIVFEVWNFN